MLVRLDNATDDLSPGSPHGANVVTEALHVLHGVDARHKDAAFPAEDELNRSQWVALDLRDPGALPLPNLTGENATPAFAWAFIVFESQAEPGHAGSVLVCDEEIRCSVLASGTPFGPLGAAASA